MLTLALPAQEKGVFALTCPSQKEVEGLLHWEINCSQSLFSIDDC